MGIKTNNIQLINPIFVIFEFKLMNFLSITGLAQNKGFISIK